MRELIYEYISLSKLTVFDVCKTITYETHFPQVIANVLGQDYKNICAYNKHKPLTSYANRIRSVGQLSLTQK